MDNKEFLDKCTRHDWFYHNADDNRVFTAGKNSYNTISLLSKTNETFTKIFKDYEAYIFSGPIFGTEKLKKPELSDYEE